MRKVDYRWAWKAWALAQTARTCWTQIELDQQAAPSKQTIKQSPTIYLIALGGNSFSNQLYCFERDWKAKYNKVSEFQSHKFWSRKKLFLETHSTSCQVELLKKEKRKLGESQVRFPDSLHSSGDISDFYAWQMWKIMKFLHVWSNFQNSPHYRCGEIWNVYMWSNFKVLHMIHVKFLHMLNNIKIFHMTDMIQSEIPHVELFKISTMPQMAGYGTLWTLIASHSRPTCPMSHVHFSYVEYVAWHHIGSQIPLHSG